MPERKSAALGGRLWRDGGWGAPGFKPSHNFSPKGEARRPGRVPGRPGRQRTGETGRSEPKYGVLPRLERAANSVEIFLYCRELAANYLDRAEFRYGAT